jgi:hypothetical protein
MHISAEGKIGIGLGLFALGGAGAIMVAPEQLWIGWGMIGTAAIGCAALLAHHFQKTIKETSVLVLVGTGLIIAGGAIGLVGAMRMDASREATLNPSEGPLRVQGISFPVDYASGVKADGIVWQKGFAHIEVTFYNPLKEPITDIDATLRPEFPIIKSAAISDFAKCQIGPVAKPLTPMILTPTQNGEHRVVGDSDPTDEDVLIISAHRLYCDKLTPKTLIRAVLATVVSINDVMSPRMFEEHRKDSRFVDVFLRYEVHSKRYEESFRLTFQGR